MKYLFQNTYFSGATIISYNYFLVTIDFSNQPLLEVKYFLSAATEKFFSRISNYSDSLHFWSRYFFQTATYLEKELF